MDTTKAQSTADFIIKDIFGVENTFSLEQLKTKFAYDLKLPQKVTCDMSGQETYVHDERTQASWKHVKQSFLESKLADEDMMRPKRPIDSMDDILKYWEEVNYLTSEKVLNSKDVFKSDGIIGSSNVYESSMIFNSKNILLSRNNFNSNYLIASDGNNGCNIGIRLFDNQFCTSSYEVNFSNKISKSLFITDCFDMFECMFCFFTRSKKYCIANMQYEKEEYFKIKKMVIDWILNT